MKHAMAVILGLLVVIAAAGHSSAAETDLKGSADHPLVKRLPGFYISGYSHVEYGNYPFNGQTGKKTSVEGSKTFIEYRLTSNTPVPGELKIRRTLQNDVKSFSGNVLFDDSFNKCSTFVIRNGGKETWVDVRAYDRMYRLTIVEKDGESATPAAVLEKPARTLDPALVPGGVKRPPERIPVAANPWPQWMESARKSVRQGFPMWLATARITGGIVNGSRVTGGSLEGPSMQQMLSLWMQSDQVPKTITDGIMGTLSDALTLWGMSLQVPNLTWYPAFEVYPGPMAPPTPSAAWPFSALVQTMGFLEPSTLSSGIRMRIGADAMTPEAKTAIDDFCTWFTSGFKLWVASATIKDVIGTGPVPTYNPGSNIFVGPVVNGTATGGTISPTPTWP
jgi:hypothetical protein